MRSFAAGLLLVVAACGPVQHADVTKAAPFAAARLDPLPIMNSFGLQNSTPPTRSNAELADDFMDLEFDLESGRALPFLTRFEGPVTVAMKGTVPSTAAADLGILIARLRAEAGIDITFAQTTEPSITIEFLPRKRMQDVVPGAACFVAPRVTSWAQYRKNRRSGLLDWTTLMQREHLAIFIPSDTSPQEVRDCLHEELAQALGPLNDLYRLSDSVFNDDNFQAVLTGFDMLMLRLHYSPDLQNGMKAAEVAARLPGILAKLNPRGAFAGPTEQRENFHPWTSLIETALGPNIPDAARLKAAEQALAIARSHGWTDNRLAFSYFAVARLNLGTDVPRAIASFSEASRLYAGLPDSPVHIAHVDMQMAAFALSSGQPEATVALADRSIAVAMRAQNAALLASLLLLKAQALDQLGRTDDAQAVRLDSLGWARYGFGPEQDVRARISDIAALSAR